MKNFFRIFLAAFTVTLVAAAIALFFYTEQRSNFLNDYVVSSKAKYSDWEKQNNCLENPQPCADYSKEFQDSLTRFEQKMEQEMEKPQFQYYILLKDIDEQYVPDLKSGGLASLGLAGVLLLLLVFSTVYLLGGSKKTKSSGIKNEKLTKKIEPIKIQPTQTQALPTKTEPAAVIPKPDVNNLLRKATECADSEPIQAISYLEQAIEGSLDPKLSIPALLLCGSLRLENKIGEDKGREQLEKIISASPQSSEAKKAQIVLDTFK